MMRASVFIWILANFFTIEAQNPGLFIGSPCELQDGSAGVCQLSIKCAWLIESLEKRLLTLDQIISCGFIGHTSIVCCADVPWQPPLAESCGAEQSTAVPNETRGRKIANACQEYSKLAAPNTDRSIIHGIIRGTEVALAEYSHAVALGYPNADGSQEFNCGGSLISEQWVLTAGHCITPRHPPNLIRMGVVDVVLVDVNTVDRKIARTVRHPSYNAALKQNDIALIQLDRPVEFSDRVRPACIRTQLEDVSTETGLIVIGWGSTSYSKQQRPEKLQKGQVNSVPFTECNAILLQYNELANQPSLRYGLIDSQLCARDSTSHPDRIMDTCAGDSGGPIFTYESGLSTLVGVTSFGISCATSLPSVYTRIASFVDWIECVVWPN